MEQITEVKFEKAIEQRDRKIRFLERELSAIKKSRLWTMRNLYRKIMGKKEPLGAENRFIDYEEAENERPLGLDAIGTIEQLNLPDVDIIAVNYNSKKYINDFLEGLSNIDYPAEKLRVFIIDNDSKDDSLYYLYFKTRNIKNIFINESEENLGFTGGYNIGLRLSKAEYKLLVNIDTKIHSDCIRTLVGRMEADPKMGMCEARQAPHEHPKEYDIATGETAWCSGACVMLRDEALKDTGFFDDKFFLYAEDVDLSWRMWSMDWKCVYEPKAECVHYNFDPNDSKKPRYVEFMYGVRNGLFMRFIYGSVANYLLYIGKVFQVILLSRGHDRTHKKAAWKAFWWHLLFLSHLWTRRRLFRKSKNAKSPYIKFYGMDYAKHRVIEK